MTAEGVLGDPPDTQPLLIVIPSPAKDGKKSSTTPNSATVAIDMMLAQDPKEAARIARRHSCSGYIRLCWRHLGVDTAELSDTSQYIICAGSLFLTLVAYGWLQELLVMKVFHREHCIFLSCFQFLCYSVLSGVQVLCEGGTERKTPLKTYILLSFLQTVNQSSAYFGMQYVSYPVKVIFKSCRVLPTMAFGAVFQARRYSTREYISALLLVVGLLFFMGAEMGPRLTFNHWGTIIMCTVLLADAWALNVQDEALITYHSTHKEMVLYTSCGGFIYTFIFGVLSGGLARGIEFTRTEARDSSSALFLYALCGFLGMNCVVALNKRFGAVTCAITTTLRKLLTVVLSFFIFSKPFSQYHMLGAFLVAVGISMRFKGFWKKERDLSFRKRHATQAETQLEHLS